MDNKDNETKKLADEELKKVSGGSGGRPNQPIPPNDILRKIIIKNRPPIRQNPTPGDEPYIDYYEEESSGPEYLDSEYETDVAESQ